MKKMTGLILAAGFSSRMEAFKPLLPFQGEPLIIRQINTMKDAGLEKIVVVTGYESEDIKNLLGNSVHLVHNEDFQRACIPPSFQALTILWLIFTRKQKAYYIYP